MPAIIVHPEVEQALRDGQAVIALESAVITHGLPRVAMSDPPGSPSRWNADQPLHLETARAMQRAVREGGGVPATVGIIDGRLHIGLDDGELAGLAAAVGPVKASVGNLAHAMTSGAMGGTTVSATLAACELAGIATIRVFATGGIGGVHPGWSERPDISADLREIATHQVCIVCSGPKSLLDLPATVEALESLGVPIVGFGTDVLPRFQARGADGPRLTQRVDEVNDAAALCHTQWQVLKRNGGVLLANPVPADEAVESDVLDRAVADANRVADASGIDGSERTPFVLNELVRLTGGQSLRANVALLLSNARLAGQLAVALRA